MKVRESSGKTLICPFVQPSEANDANRFFVSTRRVLDIGVTQTRAFRSVNLDADCFYVFVLGTTSSQDTWMRGIQVSISLK